MELLSNAIITFLYQAFLIEQVLNSLGLKQNQVLTPNFRHFLIVLTNVRLVLVSKRLRDNWTARKKCSEKGNIAFTNFSKQTFSL